VVDQSLARDLYPSGALGHRIGFAGRERSRERRNGSDP
jgi:hypothetical protein